jgi:ATP-binding cassette subfamily F protein 3
MVRRAKDVASIAAEEHPGGGHITVTAQQSRYALDAVDAPASKEVRTNPTLVLKQSSPHVSI